MAKRNPHLAKLQSGYLFPEINKRKQAFLARQPNAALISLGIGDTTQPLAPHIAEWLQSFSNGLATSKGYSGYGAEQGNYNLRQKLAEVVYNHKIGPTEVFVSDGAKCDIGRLQLMFGAGATIAVQDPTYPVYVDTGVAMGQTQHYDHEKGHYSGIVYMDCKPENDFFPDLESQPRTELIYFCSPNNPTGSAVTRSQLQKLVNFAKRNHSILIFDAAYSVYINDPSLPKSIYEIEGAHEVAIELGSFSKMAGFTGVRLAWSVVPEKLCYDDGTPVNKDWNRINTTFFNGASNIAQNGGLAVLEKQGMEAVNTMVRYYMKNATLLRDALQGMGYQVFGGIHAPYLWVKFPGRQSWDVFEDLLEKAHIVTTPGSGFGKAGEGFLRLSAFGHREHVEEAIVRLKRHCL